MSHDPVRFKVFQTLGTSMALYAPVEYTNELPSFSNGQTTKDGCIKIRASLNTNERTFVLAHEVLHHAFEHFARGVGKDPIIWGLATDHVINTILYSLGLHGDGVTFPGAPEGPAEAVYRWLMQQAKRVGSNAYIIQGEKAQMHDDGSITYGDRSVTPLDPTTKTESSGTARAEFEQTQKSRGHMPYGVAREVQRADQSKVKWYQILKHKLIGRVSKYSSLYTYTKRPFFAASLLKRQGVRVPGAMKVGLSVVYAIDTSGSMYVEELSQALAELLELRKHVSDLWVVSCDADVHEVLHNPTPEQVKLKGQGGTDFRPTFKLVEERRWKPNILIYFTDLMGEFPETAPGYPVIWIVMEHPGVKDFKPPFGQVILI